MRHLKRTAKLGRTGSHRNAMLANLVCSLIQHKRVTTTLAKAKAARSVAEKMVTLGKRGTLHDRRLVTAHLKYNPRRVQKTKALSKKARENDIVRILFEEIAPTFKDRRGGYTRILKLNQRQGDAAELAILEWVELPTTGAPAGEKAAGEAQTQPAAEAKFEPEKK
jgi:large subunit ribosomal protein L17